MFKTVIIDDEPWILSGLEELVDWNALGYEISGMFTDSAEALDFIRVRPPDVVVTDIRMPGLSGIQLLDQLKRERIHVEILLISAYRDFEAAREGIRCGAFQYILKPFDQEEVELILNDLRRKILENKVPLIIDLTHPQTVVAPLLQPVEQGRVYCALLLCDRPLREESGGDLTRRAVNILNLPYTAYLLESRRPLHDAYAEKANDNPSDSRGMSRVYPDFSMIDSMVQEATLALRHGFSYASNSPVAEIQLYLCQRVREELSLAEIASHFFISENYLSSMFKKSTGNTLTAFIQDARTFQAARLLLRTDRKLREISEDLGYPEYNYFGRLFKRRFGVSPEMYRRASTIG